MRKLKKRNFLYNDIIKYQKKLNGVMKVYKKLKNTEKYNYVIKVICVGSVLHFSADQLLTML